LTAVGRAALRTSAPAGSSATPYAAATPISGAPRMARRRMASATSAAVVSLR
jgi:hypothetical protein